MRKYSSVILTASLMVSALCILPAFTCDYALASTGSSYNKQGTGSASLAGSYNTSADLESQALANAVKNKLASDPLLNNVSINIRTKDNDVILSGSVNTKIQAEKIVMLCESMNEVNNVDADHLKVKDSDEPLTDTYITAKVKGMLLRSNLITIVNLNRIRVETHNFEVYLSGYLENQSQINKAINVAKSIENVKGVKSDLKIGKE